MNLEKLELMDILKRFWCYNQRNELWCICCSLVGDFETSLKEVLDTYHPDRVIIEPSGVGKLSDVIKAVSTINSDEMELDNFITVVDAKKCRMYTKNFGEFYNNQVEHASLIVLSRSQDLTEFQLKECLDILKGLNDIHQSLQLFGIN